MEQKTKKIVNVAMTVLLGAGTIGMTTHAMAKSKCPVEKCYGIVKKAKNECGTPKHACAGQATRNNNPNEWIYVMKGTCNMITGGSLKPPVAQKK